jgi:hypothetical protein
MKAYPAEMYSVIHRAKEGKKGKRGMGEQKRAVLIFLKECY